MSVIIPADLGWFDEINKTGSYEHRKERAEKDGCDDGAPVRCWLEKAAPGHRRRGAVGRRLISC